LGCRVVEGRTWGECNLFFCSWFFLLREWKGMETSYFGGARLQEANNAVNTTKRMFLEEVA